MANLAASVTPETRQPTRPSARSGTMMRERWEIILLSIPALIIVLALFIYPFIYGLEMSLHTDPQGGGPRSLDNYIQFFNDSSQTDSIWMTAQIALPTTLFSVALSVPLAYVMRRGIRFERLITTLLILPITLGSVVVAQSMLMYFGPQGWFNQALLALHLIPKTAPLKLIHNVIGVDIALFIQGFPFVFLMVLGYMSGISPDLERASRMLGANAWQTFWRVIFPMTLPGIAIAFCLNFVANFTVFPSATIVGEPNRLTRVLAITAYRAFAEQPNPPQGIAIALIMGTIEFVVIAVVLWLRSQTSRSASLGVGKGV